MRGRQSREEFGAAAINLPAMSIIDALRALVEDRAVVWGFIGGLALVLALTPLTVRLAHRIGALDTGGDRPRIHAAPIPRIGGLAIVVAILVPTLLLVDLHGALLGIVIGMACVAVIGLVDDLRGLVPGVKLVAVALVSLIPVLGWDMTFSHITLPVYGYVSFGAFAVPLTVFWITLVANLVNLIDGMDSLAAGIVAIACAAFALLAASFGRLETAAIAAIVCGATLGFLRHNYHPAKVFMGDCGALALGFVLGSLAVEGVLKSAATIALAAPLLVLAVPLLDTSFVVLKRLKYRRAPWSADHNHFYHRFLRIGFSQRRTAAYLHVWAALLAGYAILLRFVPPRPYGVWDTGNTLIAAAAGIGIVAASIWIVYRLEIIKARHLQVFGLRRAAPKEAELEQEQEQAVEPALTAGPR